MHTGAPFPLPYFSLWVWIGIVWGFLSSVIITFLPLYESRAAILKVSHGCLSHVSESMDDDSITLLNQRINQVVRGVLGYPPVPAAKARKNEDVDASIATAASDVKPAAEEGEGGEEAKMAVAVVTE